MHMVDINPSHIHTQIANVKFECSNQIFESKGPTSRNLSWWSMQYEIMFLRYVNMGNGLFVWIIV